MQALAQLLDLKLKHGQRSPQSITMAIGADPGQIVGPPIHDCQPETDHLSPIDSCLQL